MRGARILFVVNEAAEAHLTARMLDDETVAYHYSYEYVTSETCTLRKLQERQFDLVILGLTLPDTYVTKIINQLHELDADLPVVVSGRTNKDIESMTIMQKEMQPYLVKCQQGYSELNRVLELVLEKKSNEKTRHAAHQDNLTGLANRALFYDTLEKALGKSQRSMHETVLLLIDLDKFKKLNEDLGSIIGDKILKEVGCELSSCVSGDDIVARLGGDDFAMVLCEIKNFREVCLLAEQIVAILTRTRMIDGHKVNIGGSVGIASYPLCKSISHLMYSAEKALFRAKNSGGNRYKIFTDNLSQEAVWKYGLETDLGDAIEKEQFVLHYQPQLDLHTGQLAGVEALLRWQHPKAGLLLPRAFIEQLETSQVGWDASEWILMQACQHLKSWQRLGNPDLKMDINFSPFQLRDPALVSRVKRVLQKTGMAARHIEFELTERQPLLEGDSLVALNISELLGLGIRFVLDDYGTGHNSDKYLRRFPGKTISTIKIDRSYIEHVATNPTYASCVKRDIDFAHDLGMQVVAEGIENIEQMEYVKALGADMIQGYLVSKAISEPFIASGIYQDTFDLHNIYGRQDQRIAV